MGRRLTEAERQLRSLSERVHQQSVTDLATMYGWRWIHFHDSRRQVRPGVFIGDEDAKGFPDLLLIRPPEIVVIECKKELGKTTPDQDEWLALFAGCGVPAIVSRPSNFDEVVAILCAPRKPPLSPTC